MWIEGGECCGLGSISNFHRWKEFWSADCDFFVSSSSLHPQISPMLLLGDQEAPRSSLKGQLEICSNHGELVKITSPPSCGSSLLNPSPFFPCCLLSYCSWGFQTQIRPKSVLLRLPRQPCTCFSKLPFFEVLQCDGGQWTVSDNALANLHSC